MQQPIQHAPESLRKQITKFGGTVASGVPTWRLVVANSVRRRFDGRLPVWPAGEIKTSEFVRDEKNGTLFQVPKHVAPDRWEMGPHYIPKYPCQGWILERWMPPHIFGDKDTWEKQRDQWGDPIMGPFPNEGDYWMLDGPWERIPELSLIERSIASTERDRNNQPQFFEFTLKRLIKEQEDDEEKAFQKWEAELAKYCKSEIDPIFKTLSLGAQRVRDEVQKSLGEGSHLGAGQQ